MTSEDAQRWMQIATDEARSAQQHGDVPVGCVVVGPEGDVIARGHNRREADEDPTAHAEVVAMRAAAAAAGSWRLVGCTLVVTLEPCPMCAGAIINARVPRVIFGTADPKGGAAGSMLNLLDDARLNHRPQVIGGVLAEVCAEQLRAFFRKQRSLGKK